MQDLKIIFGQQIKDKWDHCLLSIQNVKHLLDVIKKKKGKTVPNSFIETGNESHRHKKTNYGINK